MPPWHCFVGQRGELAVRVVALRSLLGEGRFCANFSAMHGPWTPCHRAWHGCCYCTTDNGKFPIASPQDEAGEILIDDLEDAKCFLVAQDGDNLTISFQCDDRHFINVMG